MMQFKNYILSIASLLTVLISACNKKNNNSGEPLPDIVAPKVKYTKPTNGVVMSSILPINIIGTITDNQDLKSYSLKVYNETDNKLEFSKVKDLSGTTGHTINENFVKNNPNNVIYNYLLTSEVKDAAGLTAIDSIRFIVQ